MCGFKNTEDGYDTYLMFNKAYKVLFHNCCLTVGTVEMSAAWDVMFCIFIKIHMFLDEGSSRIL